MTATYGAAADTRHAGGATMTVAGAARDLVRRGFSPVPIPFREKKPKLTDWQQLRITETGVAAYFNGAPQNVGIILGAASNHAADVDLDAPEAVAAAPYFLPETGLRHGRSSKPGSHWHYRTPDAPELRRTAYVDTARKGTAGKPVMLVELRANGNQTLIPPSTHPNGEVFAWEANGEPASVSAAVLQRAVAFVAATALLAFRWPSGARHDTSLALAGFLGRNGMPEHEIERLLEAVARVSGDPEWRDRVQTARDTTKRLARGEHVTGGPRLVDLLPDGQHVVACLTQWLNLTACVTDETPAPLDIFGDTTLAGAPALEPGMLPDVIARFATDEAERLGVDLAMIALPCLVAGASCIDDGFRIQPKRHDEGWTESARLWVGLVDESGAKKSPALRKATAPLRAVERGYLAADLPTLSAYDRAMQRYRADARRRSGREPGEEPVRPRIRRLIVDDATVEALTDILADNPRGVLCVRDELAGWFGSFDAYRKSSGQDRAHWLELFNGGPRPVDRVNRGRVLVPNWSACLLGGIQPGPMRRLAARLDDDGLLQRFIVVFPAPGADEVDRAPDHAAHEGYTRTVRSLLTLDPGANGPVYRLGNDAQAVRAIVTRVARNVSALPDTSAAFRSHLANWDALFARLLLTYHLTNAAAAGAAPDATVDGDTAERVGRLLTDFLLPHAVRFYSEILGAEHLTHARWLAGYILARQLDRISARDIGRAYPELRGDTRKIAATMAQLEVVGWATPVESPRGPLPTKWTINPQVHARFADRATAERHRREAIRHQIAEAAAALGLKPEDA